LPESALLEDGELDSLALGERHHGTIAVANDKASAETGGESVSGAVLNVDNIETSEVPFAGHENANTARIAALGDHNKVANLKGNNINNLSSGEVDLDGIVDLDERVGEADGPSIVGGDGGDLLRANLFESNLAELPLGLLIVQSVKDEASLGIVEKAELIAALGEADDVHETSGKAGIGADLAVDLNLLLHADRKSLLRVKRVFEAVAENENQGKALAELVRSSGRAGSPDASHLGEHPVLGGIEPLEVLLGSTSHDVR